MRDLVTLFVDLIWVVVAFAGFASAEGSEALEHLWSNLRASADRSGNGMIWHERPGSRRGKLRMFIFFVGTEDQSKSQLLPGFPAPVCP